MKKQRHLLLTLLTALFFVNCSGKPTIPKPIQDYSPIVKTPPKRIYPTITTTPPKVNHQERLGTAVKKYQHLRFPLLL